MPYEFNFADYESGDESRAAPAPDSDAECEAVAGSWAELDRGLLQRIAGFLPRQSDRRSLCLVSKDWALAVGPMLWAYPQFATPEQLAAFQRTVTERPDVFGPRVRGVRCTLSSHFDRHLQSAYYSASDGPSDAELPALLEIAQGRHVLSTDPAILRPLLQGSDLTSPPLAFKFARACSPIDCLSIYGFRLRDKHIAGDLMRWRLREVEIIGMPRKPLATLGQLLCSLSGLRQLRLESDAPLPADVWGPIALRLRTLRSLRICAPAIATARLAEALRTGQGALDVLHLVGSDCDAGDELVTHLAAHSPRIRSLVVHSARLTAQSARTALAVLAELVHLELARYDPEPLGASAADAGAASVVAARLTTLSLRNLAVGDNLVAAAAPVVTRLRALHICGALDLHGAPVAALLGASTRLAALGLYDCPQLSDAALVGLASGASAESVQVLLVRQCAMQSDGIERALPALTALKHFSVVGAEAVQQLFQYAFEPLSPVDAPVSAPAVSRSFRPTYPPDHFFCKSDPDVAAASAAAARDLAAVAASVPHTPRTAWRDYSARRFVPGLLAFAQSDASLDGPSRRRATTVSTGSPVAADFDGSQAPLRARSLSEVPAAAVASPADPDSSHAAAGAIAAAVGAVALGIAAASELAEPASEPIEEPAEVSSPADPVADELAAADEPAAEEPAAEEPTAAEEPAAEAVATEEPAVAVDEPAAAEEPVSIEEPATVEESAVAEEPAAEEPAAEEISRDLAVMAPDAEEPTVDETAAVEDPAAVEPTAAEETPAAEEPTAVEEPAAEEEAVATEEPVAADEPVATEELVAVEESTAEEPAADEPAFVEEPAAEDTTAEELALADGPAAADVPTAVEDPAAVEEPAVEEPTAIEESADAEEPASEEPAAEDAVAVDEPAGVEEPAPAEEPAAAEETAAAEDPAVEEPVAVEESTAAEEPAAEEPAAEEPAVEEPAVEESAVDESAAED
ncbi:hypothetical protein H4R19_004446, partial [Coemansia spiralis]